VEGRTEGLREGREAGRQEGASVAAQALLLVLRSRGLHVPPELEQRILACGDPAVLAAWLHPFRRARGSISARSWRTSIVQQVRMRLTSGAHSSQSRLRAARIRREIGSHLDSFWRALAQNRRASGSKESQYDPLVRFRLYEYRT
jgi:hypothetical protein